MSYCDGSTGDVYLYPSRGIGIICAECTLAPLVPTIVTTGRRGDQVLGPLDPCAACQGQGCAQCMIHGSLNFATPQDAYAHLIAHRQAGHVVPQEALERLIAEGAQPFGGMACGG